MTSIALLADVILIRHSLHIYQDALKSLEAIQIHFDSYSIYLLFFS